VRLKLLKLPLPLLKPPPPKLRPLLLPKPR